MKTKTRTELTQYVLLGAIGLASIGFAVHCGNAGDSNDEDLGRLTQAGTSMVGGGSGDEGKFRTTQANPRSILLAGDFQSTYGLGNCPACWEATQATGGGDSTLCHTDDASQAISADGECVDDPATNELTTDTQDTDTDPLGSGSGVGAGVGSYGLDADGNPIVYVPSEWSQGVYSRH